MCCKLSGRSIKFTTRLAFGVLFLFGLISQSSAQIVPPLDVPLNNLPARDPDAIAIDGWQLYPALRLYSVYSDNLFQSPLDQISVPGIGLAPSLTAIWSNGIHTTTLYGNIDRQAFPTDNAVNTIDGRAGFTEKYEAMRDIIFTVNGNFAHTTWSTGLQNSIQTPATAPSTTVLPNGNTVLPTGTILSPTGQPVGQVNAASGSSIPLVVNPFNQYTGTFTVDKIFNRGIMSLSASIGRTEFDDQSVQPNFTSRTFTENASSWLSPLIYAYSNGSVGTVATDATSGSPTALLATSTPSSTTTSYRVVGGLGTRPLELFSGSAYIGHQGSEVDGSTAGGYVYGAALTYNPTTTWTLTGTVDRTTNIASQIPSSTNLALTLPGLSAVQVSIGQSTQITSAGLRTSYEITPQWFANGQLAYSHIAYTSTPRLDNSWVLDATLRYEMLRNLSLTWEYRYTSVLSNAPLVPFASNYGLMSATYRF
jgi:putative beta-barrel porin BBP2